VRRLTACWSSTPAASIMCSVQIRSRTRMSLILGPCLRHLIACSHWHLRTGSLTDGRNRISRTGILGLMVSVAQASRLTVPVTTSGMTSATSRNRPFYVLTVDVPEDLSGKRLDTATLEFYVDAALVSGEEAEHSPTIDVRALTAAYSPNDELSSSSALGRARPVPLGHNRKVVVDITDMVKAWIASPSSNHGIVVGSLGGSKAGDFTVRSDVLGGSKVATVTYFYQNRSGERISERQ
jgi:hypothetical protein